MRQPSRCRIWRDGRLRKAIELRNPEGGEGGGGGGGGRGGEVEEEVEEGGEVKEVEEQKVFILSSIDIIMR